MGQGRKSSKAKSSKKQSSKSKSSKSKSSKNNPLKNIPTWAWVAVAIIILLIFFGSNIDFNSNKTTQTSQTYQDESGCSELSSESKIFSCYNSLAIDNDDSEICNGIASEVTRDKCINNVLDVQKFMNHEGVERERCNENYNTDSRYFYSCVYQVGLNLAKKTDNTKPCNYELDSSENSYFVLFKDQCLKNLATYDKNPEICLEIEADAAKSFCLSSLIPHIDNKDLCSKIQDASQRSICLAQ